MRSILACAATLSLATAAAASGQTWQATADYSRSHSGDALLVLRGDSIVFEEYQNGYRATTPHMLASGSKSFVCAIAVSALADGLITLDEPVVRTITEWQGDARREQVTIRHLLNLSSGLAPGVNGFEGGPIRATLRADALRTPMLAEPGVAFGYGPSNFDVFGELMRRRLNGEKPDAYLQRKVLDRIGLTGLEWRRDSEGMPMLPGGGFTTAREWLKYGKLIRDEGRWNGEQVLDPALLRECTTPSTVNPSYGLTFWLTTDARAALARARAPAARANRAGAAPATPVIMAAGAGVQRLYVLRELDLVVVRLGRADPAWSDSEFVRRITAAVR